MKVEKSTVTKLLLTDLHRDPHRLDPVTVILEDVGHRVMKMESGDHITRQGKIIIECHGESWSSYWGGMGDQTVAEFFADCSADYLAGCLRRGADISFTQFSGQALKDGVRKVIINCRRGRESWRYECGRLDKEDARRLYDEADDLSSFDGCEALMYSREVSDLFTQLFGEEWHHAVTDLAFVPHPKYQYLQRVVGAVQEGLQLVGLVPAKAVV